ncbi:MAG: hypothetical protein WC908_01665 [Candidatus Paceibacterota bacterium]
MKIKIFSNVAKVCVVLLVVSTLIYRITEIMLFKGTVGYSFSSAITGMITLILLLAVSFFCLHKKQKWGFWYCLFLFIFLLLAYLFKAPFVWPYAVFVILSIIPIISLFILKKEFK